MSKKDRIIKVVLCKVGEPAKVHEFAHSLEEMQKLVGGYVECIQIGHQSRFGGKDNVDMWCNEEGKLTHPIRWNLREPFDPLFPHDVVAGDFFLASSRNGGMMSLSDKLIEKYLRLFANPHPNAESTLRKLLGM